MKLDVKEPAAGDLMGRLNRLVAAEQQARQGAARTATTATRSHFHYLRPANAPARPGRRSTGGRFTTFLQWQAQSAARGGGVAFDVAEADTRVPYWIIQEIGTGQRALIRRAGANNPVGRPRSGAQYVRTVKPQRGRQIPASLAFGTGPRGTFTPPGASRGQQLYLRSLLRRAPTLPQGPRRGLFITREIRGQHFVQAGGEAGFREYRTSVLAAARRAFAGKGRRP